MRGKIIERGKKRGVFIRRIIAFNLTCEFVCICFCVRSDEECSNDKIEKLAVLRESTMNVMFLIYSFTMQQKPL